MGFLLHHSISESADRLGDREAFRCSGEALGYGELVQRSNRLANLLREHGVQRGDRVGIYLGKSLELPIALYGILAAGAAYVPIDPTAPPDRVRFLIEDCGIRHVVADGGRAKRLRQLALQRARGREPLRLVVGAGDAPEEGCATHFATWSEVDSHGSTSPDVRQVEDDLAYIMVTSGSTGVPKGLMHTHRSGLAYARLSAREYGVTEDDRLGNHSPLHFDMSTFEYLTGPLCGATTVLIPEEVTMFPRSVAELIERERLTFWYSVPLALVQLLVHGGIEQRQTASLRWVLFGGEPFPTKHLARLVALWPQARFSNSYGPAEVNQCTAYHLPPGPWDPSQAVPIGRVWPGAEGLVVDEKDQPVAAGEEGELLIRSATMMRGYWARPDLNQAAFYRRERYPGFTETFYRTGDLVRQRADGELLFLGRRDRQIKVRGYRVELDEVETVLAGLEGVAEAAAFSVDAADGSLSIAAAVILQQGATCDVEALRRLAGGKLPAYAVPTRVEERTDFPRTTSGKIDRRALAAQLGD